MKVLWFAVTPSMYAESKISHNGGGWIASLESLVKKHSDIKLGIAFEHSDNKFCVNRDNVSYYPINVWRSKLSRFKRKFIFNTEQSLIIPACIKIIDDFRPDIIHIFGSEWCFGLIKKHTDIPIVIHMQGSIPPYYNARFPVGYNIYDYILFHKLRLTNLISLLLYYKNFKLQSKREEIILRLCSNFMGRTEWDENITKLYSPNSNYFLCNEALRDPFMNSELIWKPHKRDITIITSTISSPLYKGVDVILKTAKLLIENTSLNFEWRIFGIQEIKFHEWKNNLFASNLNIKLMGTLSAESLKAELFNSDIFIHPSYIDNSPNSICEAQILGVPIISTNVGGIPSIVEHMKTGLLVPANDPFSISTYILKLVNNQSLSAVLGKNSREVSLIRHNPIQIMKDLNAVYLAIINRQVQ